MSSRNSPKLEIDTKSYEKIIVTYKNINKIGKWLFSFLHKQSGYFLIHMSSRKVDVKL